jgi:hypothetical protein
MLITSHAWFDETPTNSFSVYSYNDKGLMSARVFQDGSQYAFAYNKSGYMTTSAELDKKGNPVSQTIYTIKKGKLTAQADYDIDEGKVTLEDAWQFSYKKGNASKDVYTTADGKTSLIATYKKGVLSQVVYVSPYRQEVRQYDEYGNDTRSTLIGKRYDGSTSRTETTVYNNTYKSGKLVKTVWTEATTYPNSSDVSTTTGVNVYTYKKGKLVQKVSAWNNSSYPEYTYGETFAYSYTKGGLISTAAYAYSVTSPTETQIVESATKAYQYKKVAVNNKCVKAVKESMGQFGYEYYLPGSDYSDLIYGDYLF